MSNSPAQKTMTENLHPKDKALEKIAGIQFLRLNEVMLLRAVHRVFVYRRKNLYRRDILTHITAESATSALAVFPEASRKETVVYNNLKVMQDLGIVTQVGDRNTFPQYKQKNEALEHTVRRHSTVNPVFYEFDSHLVKNVLRHLHEIEYVPLTKWHRTVVGILQLAPKESWWTVNELTGTSMDAVTLTDRLCNKPDDEIFFRLVEVDRREPAYKYRITDFGKKVIDAWNEVSQLLSRANEEATNSETVPSIDEQTETA